MGGSTQKMSAIGDTYRQGRTTGIIRSWRVVTYLPPMAIRKMTTSPMEGLSVAWGMVSVTLVPRIIFMAVAQWQCLNVEFISCTFMLMPKEFAMVECRAGRACPPFLGRKFRACVRERIR